MEKYLGNKSKLLDFIYTNVEKELKDCDRRVIFDAFTGTTNVGKFFKSKGYDVVVNDINDLSFVLGKTYIECKKLPKFLKLINSDSYFANNYKKVKDTKAFKEKLNTLIRENKNMISKDFLEKYKDTDYFYLIVYLTYYSSPADYDNNKIYALDFLQKNYCEFGTNSRYINLKYKKTLDNAKAILEKENNQKALKFLIKFYQYPYDIKFLDKSFSNIAETSKAYLKLSHILEKDNIVGTRKFFSIDHAKRLDIIINTILFWYKMELLDRDEFYILLASIIETISIFSNTSATYQAFYKDYKANTLQPFRLIVPEIIEGVGNYKVLQGDVFESIDKVDADILYLDPPYNWRQYDSNYHLLNTVSKINKVNLNEFEKNIIGASGENRHDKLIYTSFNKRSTFEDQLFEIMKRSKAKIIVLSYSDSESNHKVNENNKTVEKIANFMQNEKYFMKDTFKLIKYHRKNFESRKDNKKLGINELLFIVRKKDKNSE